MNSVADAVPARQVPKYSAPESPSRSLATAQPRGRLFWLPTTQCTAVMSSKGRQKLAVARVS